MDKAKSKLYMHIPEMFLQVPNVYKLLAMHGSSFRLPSYILIKNM